MNSGSPRHHNLQRRLLVAVCVATQVLAGCAVHYGDSRSGAEHLWGFGQLRLARQPVGSNLTSVVTGVRVPGLCVELGRDHFGFTFGYLNRQRLAVVNVRDGAGFQPPAVAPGIPTAGNTSALWAFGHLKMRTLPESSRCYAIVTGKALAGLGAGFGEQDNNISLALDGRQTAVVLDENVRLDFNQDARRWPGFDLFAMTVNASVSENPNQDSTTGEP